MVVGNPIPRSSQELIWNRFPTWDGIEVFLAIRIHRYPIAPKNLQNVGFTGSFLFLVSARDRRALLQYRVPP